MPRIEKSALVPYSADEMFELVTDISKYGDFLPWCGGARVLQREGDEVTAEIDIAYKSVKQSFTTETVSYTHLTLPTTLPRCRSRWSPYH